MANILIVDDDAPLRASLSRVLHKLGYGVLEAEDGKAAMDRLEREHPEALLLDLRMPRQGGLETLQQIRSRGLSVAVVAMSGAAGGTGPETMLGKAAALGVDALLEKPFTLTEILDALGELGLAPAEPS